MKICFVPVKRENFQLTVVTLTLETGLNAQLNVEMELKPEQEHARTLLLPMVVLTVLDLPLKLRLVDKEIVQVNWQIMHSRGEIIQSFMTSLNHSSFYQLSSALTVLKSSISF